MLNVVVIIVHLSLLLLDLSYLSHLVNQGRPSPSEQPLQGYQVLPPGSPADNVNQFFSYQYAPARVVVLSRKPILQTNQIKIGIASGGSHIKRAQNATSMLSWMLRLTNEISQSAYLSTLIRQVLYS